MNAPEQTAVVCPLCNREIPSAQRDLHHLVPKSKGGRRTEFLHRVCHRQIHALLTESELARQYATIDALVLHPELQAFIAWVKTKPDAFSCAPANARESASAADSYGARALDAAVDP